MTFDVLLVIVLAGLAGPLIGASRRFPMPAAIGQIAAGVVIGTTGFGWLDPREPTVAFLADVGFAMLMLAAGMHVPIPAFAQVGRLKRAAAAVLVAGLLAIPAGYLAAFVAGDGHQFVYAVLLAGGSAALVVPALIEQRAQARPAAITATLWIAIADIVAIILVPLVLRPERAGQAALASLYVSVIAAGVYILARLVDHRKVVKRIRKLSKKRGWALDLRLSLAVLFLLCWIAVRGGTSILVAGFSAGLVVGALGGPHRLSTQVTGVAQGFFVPLFFVVLGARIDLSGLGTEPRLIALIAVLVGANVVTHLIAAAVTGQGLGAALAACAQLGLPAAIAALGLQVGVLSPGVAAAVVVAGLCSVPIAALGVRHLARSDAATPATAPAADVVAR